MPSLSLARSTFSPYSTLFSRISRPTYPAISMVSLAICLCRSWSGRWSSSRLEARLRAKGRRCFSRVFRRPWRITFGGVFGRLRWFSWRYSSRPENKVRMALEVGEGHLSSTIALLPKCYLSSGTAFIATLSKATTLALSPITSLSDNSKNLSIRTDELCQLKLISFSYSRRVSRSISVSCEAVSLVNCCMRQCIMQYITRFMVVGLNYYAFIIFGVSVLVKPRAILFVLAGFTFSSRKATVMLLVALRSFARSGWLSRGPCSAGVLKFDFLLFRGLRHAFPPPHHSSHPPKKPLSTASPTHASPRPPSQVPPPPQPQQSSPSPAPSPGTSAGNGQPPPARS